MDNHYIAGFVDGEGSFHVAFQRSSTTRLGWQAIPEFHVSQNAASAHVLEAIRDRLQCGYVKANHGGSARDRTRVLVVRNREDLTLKVVPFFVLHPLHTEKRKDFERFREVLDLMNRRAHAAAPGFARIVALAYAMNENGYRRKLDAAVILRTLESVQCPLGRSACDSA